MREVTGSQAHDLKTSFFSIASSQFHILYIPKFLLITLYQSKCLPPPLWYMCLDNCVVASTAYWAVEVGWKIYSIHSLVIEKLIR